MPTPIGPPMNHRMNLPLAFPHDDDCKPEDPILNMEIGRHPKGEEKDDDVDSGVSDSSMIGENGDAPGEEDLDDKSLLGGLTSAGLDKRRHCMKK